MAFVARTVAIIGFSKRGKTTLACGLIEELTHRGKTVAFVKHTHHAVEGADLLAGDTGRALAAGAVEVTLAGDGRAVSRAARHDGQRITPFERPAALISSTAELVIVEGFKNVTTWPRILRCSDGEELARFDQSTLAAVVCEAALSTTLPQFRPGDLRELATFLDRIASR